MFQCWHKSEWGNHRAERYWNGHLTHGYYGQDIARWTFFMVTNFNNAIAGGAFAPRNFKTYAVWYFAMNVKWNGKRPCTRTQCIIVRIVKRIARVMAINYEMLKCTSFAATLDTFTINFDFAASTLQVYVMIVRVGCDTHSEFHSFMNFDRFLIGRPASGRHRNLSHLQTVWNGLIAMLLTECFRRSTETAATRRFRFESGLQIEIVVIWINGRNRCDWFLLTRFICRYDQHAGQIRIGWIYIHCMLCDENRW